MRNRILILLAGFSLILAAPLLAQSVDEPQPQVEPQVEHRAELQADAEDGTASASVEAEASAGISTDDSIDEDRELPQTAGFLPLLALLGLGSLASAFGLRAVRRK